MATKKYEISRRQIDTSRLVEDLNAITQAGWQLVQVEPRLNALSTMAYAIFQREWVG